jgi:hypothetical protein
MKTYSQEEQDQILDKLNTGIIGKRKQGTWDAIAKKKTITKTQCILEALKYTKKSDWETAHQSTYTTANKNGWIKECSAHMVDGFKTWTKELVEETLNDNLKSYREYLQKYENLHALKRLGMVDTVRSKFGVYKPKITLEYARKEALKYTTRKDFNEVNNRVYQWAYRNKVLDDICKHMPNLQGEHLKIK